MTRSFGTLALVVWTLLQHLGVLDLELDTSPSVTSIAEQGGVEQSRVEESNLSEVPIYHNQPNTQTCIS
jgi:hypothetical protein